ncbi:hypothetical protein ACFP9V_04235 [Deinococcus radiopugnans]|uniref:O-antigen ligase family protein n=1 Tax=Deinococcus radiopugnans ATCC 19172 TaxID=585398 RepID=A0A5C4Y6C6_9DEIO|nr:hypothetical protein [Deinococcus radiopugnans]MBB6017766.1 hypothetical protein [Deinococcus radiopugnans ATCC 19172]TNM71429.1 hypothetical protein FHR04_07705 [Deinococcus radiopugnans ATCC 19172]
MPINKYYAGEFTLPVSKLLLLLVIAIFGPYITNSFRVEHLILYPSALLAAIVIVYARQSRHPSLPLIVIWLLSGILLSSILSTFFGPYPVSFGRILSQADNWLQPIAVSVIALAWGARLRLVFGWLLGLLCLNACIQIYQTVTNNFAIMSAWISVSETGGSTAYNSFTNGRFMGVFNQPVEAGISFTIGLFLWLYLLWNGRKGLWFWLALPLLLIGGTLTVSKIFLVLGLPLFLTAVFWERVVSGWRPTWSGLSRGVLLVAVIITAGGLIGTRWSGADYAIRLLMPSQSSGSLFELYTASRLGDDTGLAMLFKQVIRDEPFSGYGFRSLEILDNGFLDAYAQGGVLALLLYIAVLLTILVVGLRKGNTPEGRLLILLAIFVIAASLGAPALTANRACIITWIFLFGLITSPIESRSI